MIWGHLHIQVFHLEDCEMRLERASEVDKYFLDELIYV